MSINYVVLFALGGSCINTCMLGSSEEGFEVLPETISSLLATFVPLKKVSPLYRPSDMM